MCELRLFNYQKEIVESKDEEIICNWSRGLGKEYTLISKIINDKPNSVIWVGNFNNVQNKIDEVLRINELLDKVESINSCRDKVTIKFFNEIIINIQKYYKGCRPIADLLVFKDILPYRIKNMEPKQTISMISVNNYDKKLQRLLPNSNIREYGIETILKYQLMSSKMLKNAKQNNRYYDEIDILSIPENIIAYKERNNRLEELMNYYDIQLNNVFLIQTLAKLQTEYDEIIPCKDNVLTRQNLLKMIMELQKMLPCKR